MERYKKIAESGTTRPKYQEIDPRYTFGTQLEKLKKEFSKTNNDIANDIQQYFDNDESAAKGSTVNCWVNHENIPEADLLLALANIYKPFSLDYLFGLSDNPDKWLDNICDYTGLSWKAIDHLKKLSKKHKDTLNAILESEYIEDIVQCIESSKGEKHHVLRDEYNALDYIKKYIEDFYCSYSENEKAPIKPELDSLQHKIERLSDEAINKPFDKVNGGSVSAFEIAAYKLRLQESFNEFFNSIVPKLKSFHYQDLKDIFDKFIKPTEAIGGYSEEYFVKILMPLARIITQEKIPQYHKDSEEGIVIENEETQKKISALYEKAQKIIETSGNDKAQRPTKKKSQRKKV